MFSRIFNWLARNKMLTFFIIVGAMVSLAGIKNLVFGIDPSAEKVRIVQYNMNRDYAIVFHKQAASLVVELKKPVYKDGKEMAKTLTYTQAKQFNAQTQDKGSQSVEEKLKADFQEILPEMLEYQSKVQNDLGLNYAPLFGVSKYPEVRKLKINGKSVDQVDSITDDKGQDWYIWVFSDLKLKPSGNSLEIGR